jgi:hypothetical protein
MSIEVSHREMKLEKFLQEFSVPVVNVGELTPRWRPEGTHRETALATFFEEALQRKSCWHDENRRRFIKSLNDGLASLSNIIVCNVRDSLDLAIKLSDEVSIYYYESILNNGFKYISLDGKNRTITLHKFIDSVFAITGAFVNIDGIPEDIDNRFFKNLSKDLQQQFLKTTTIRVTELVGLKSHVFGLFLAIHEGMPLNDMEILNASLSPISGWCRKVAAQHAAGMKYLYSDEKITRMADREWVAHTAMKYLQSYRPNPQGVVYPVAPNINKVELSAWFALGESFRNLKDNGVPYVPAELTRVEKIIAEAMRVYQAQTKYPPSKGVAWKMVNAVLMVVAEVVDGGNYIADHKAFFDALYDIDMKLSTDADQQMVADQQAAIQNGDPMPSRAKYYSYWQTVPHMSLYRAKRRQALVAEVKNNINSLTIR